jgi:glutathione peroxidase
VTTLYDHAITTMDGSTTTLAPYRGRVMLIVNVASHCGYTPQYTGLETLHRELGPRGLTVLGFPCNQFGGQEPGTSADIQQFCSLTYDVTFPVFAKVRVNGSQTHPLWAQLKDERRGFLWTRDIKWNFTKFLVARDGRVVKRFGSRDTPEEIRTHIEKLLG